jgi:hypothetical protein
MQRFFAWSATKFFTPCFLGIFSIAVKAKIKTKMYANVLTDLVLQFLQIILIVLAIHTSYHVTLIHITLLW